MTVWPALVQDSLEWHEMANEHSLGVIVPVYAASLPGLAEAREAIAELPAIMHPDHYLHITLRMLGGSDNADEVSLDAIGEIIAETASWEAEVKGLRAFPTAIWADPDVDGEFSDLVDKVLAEIGNLPEHPQRARAVGHLTLAYAKAPCPAEKVREKLEPFEDFVLGHIDVREAVLADLYFDKPYPRWTVRRRFRFRGR
ncbi:MAG: 2'-5' RNA ligase family protein [Acidimicrobiia bacterium]|nr:2'-5' RNA ligase family protein [Acidimicrobiia bacterium]